MSEGKQGADLNPVLLRLALVFELIVQGIAH